METSYTAISTLLSDAHFVLIQEHWLFNYQLKQLSLFDENVCGTGKFKAVDDSDPIPSIQKPRGYGGVGILWRKSLDHLVTVLEDGSERIQCVRVKTAEGPILIISVYIPSKGRGGNISEFQDCIYQLQEIIQKYYDHFIFIGGDLNEDLTLPSHSKRKEELVRFIDEYKLSTVPVGPTFIHPNGKDCSTIDYFIFRDTSGVDVNITCCNTLASNTSDHHPIKCVTNISAIEDGSAGKLCVAEDEVIVRVNWEKVDKDLYAAMCDKEFKNPELSIDINTIRGAFGK